MISILISVVNRDPSIFFLYIAPTLKGIHGAVQVRKRKRTIQGCPLIPEKCISEEGYYCLGEK
jgi:hypothetical protein